MWEASARIAAGALAAVAVGWGVLAPAGWSLRSLSAAGVALAAVVASALLVPPLLFAGVLCLPLSGPVLLSIVLVLCLVLVGTGSQRWGGWLECRQPTSDRWLWFARAILGLALVVGLWKLFAMPLWSWDHFAIWGVKARRMVIEGTLHLGFLDLESVQSARPDYPLALPFLWRLLALGEEPNPFLFKLSHALFLVAAIVVVRRGVGLAGGSPLVAEMVAALLAISPLVWDTVAVGLADLPLGLCAAAGIVLLLQSLGGPPSAAWIPGLVIGFLPWIKSEGWPLAVLLLLASLLLVSQRCSSGERWRRFGFLVAAAAAVMALSGLFANLFLPRGPSFFSGDWWGRGISRLPAAGAVVREMGSTLLAADWLGFWILFLVAGVIALGLRYSVAAALAGVVVAQLVLYGVVYLFAYPDPVAHIEASFFRIASAQLPLAALAIGACIAGLTKGSPAGKNSLQSVEILSQ